MDTKNLLTKRNIIIGLVLLVLAIAIPVTIRLVRQQQQLKSKAAGNSNVNFIGPNVTPCASPSSLCTSSPTIQLQLTSPFGQ